MVSLLFHRDDAELLNYIPRRSNYVYEDSRKFEFFSLNPEVKKFESAISDLPLSGKFSLIKS